MFLPRSDYQAYLNLDLLLMAGLLTAGLPGNQYRLGRLVENNPPVGPIILLRIEGDKQVAWSPGAKPAKIVL